MFQIRTLQAFLCFLWFCLIFGLFSGLRDHMYIPTLVGVAVNFMWQYGALIAIRKRKQKLASTSEG
jgi:hypothetical protein